MRVRSVAGAALAVAIAALPGLAQSVAEELQKGIYAQQTAGDLDGAIRIFRKIIASNPAQQVYVSQARTHLAQALLQQGGQAETAREPGTTQSVPSPGVPSVAAASAENSADSADVSLVSFRVQVRGLLDRGAYSELDALAGEARTQKLRFKGGAWRLSVFYGTAGSPGPRSFTFTDAQWESLIARLEGWIKASPTSPTPRVALAHAFLGFAWKARGTGYASTVTPEGWELFRQRVQSARTVLEDADKTSGRDPGWYSEMQTVALAQGWDRKQVDMLADQALASEPSYYNFAVAEANYLLPKWNGNRGETEQYAEQVANQAGGPEGDAVYFFIAAALNCCRSTQAPALSWPRVRQGFAALDQLYGSTYHQRNVMAYMALRAGDTKTAQQMFALIGNDWDGSVWRTKARFDASRTGQAVGDAQPLQADSVAGRPEKPDE